MSIPTVPSSLSPLVANSTWTPIGVGESRSDVYRLVGPGADVAYLKVSPVSPIAELLAERERLDWLSGRLPVPHVLGYATENGREFLLLSEVPGIDTSSTALDMESLDVVRLLARGLRMVHEVPIRDCPFDMTLEQVIPLTERNVELGLVEVADFDSERAGGSPGALFQVLVATRPATEDLVFTHGDYCLPNIMVDGDRLAGFIDWGYAGVGDPYRDFVAAEYSVRRNLGEAWIPLFFKEYGVEPDPEKMAVHRLLYELW